MVDWDALKSHWIKINCEIELDLRNWKLCHVTIRFRNVDSFSKIFSDIFEFLWKIDLENEWKFDIAHLKGISTSKLSY